MGDIPPCATIYVNNLNEKTKKDGASPRFLPPPRTMWRRAGGPRQLTLIGPLARNLSLVAVAVARVPSARVLRRSPHPHPPPRPIASTAELVKSLQAIFGQFGKIIDIVASKSYKLRGQAWVVFADVAAATAAMRAMQGFPFYDKPMRIAYAKTKSDATAKAEGTFDPGARDPETRAKRKAESQAAEKESQAAKAERDAASGVTAKVRTDPSAPPNEILFVQGLPGATTAAMLSMLFQQFPGFKEVRMVEAKPGIAFVEFETDTQASVALSGLQGFKINPTHSMTLAFAAK